MIPKADVMFLFLEIWKKSLYSPTNWRWISLRGRQFSGALKLPSVFILMCYSNLMNGNEVIKEERHLLHLITYLLFPFGESLWLFSNVFPWGVIRGECWINVRGLMQGSITPPFCRAQAGRGMRLKAEWVPKTPLQCSEQGHSGKAPQRSSWESLQPSESFNRICLVKFLCTSFE